MFCFDAKLEATAATVFLLFQATSLSLTSAFAPPGPAIRTNTILPLKPAADSNPETRRRRALILCAGNNNANTGSPKLLYNLDDINVSGVTLKLAFDASDSWGIADMSAEKSERFTSPQSLDMVHRLRAQSDCVLVGRGTVEADDCTLTVRRGYEKLLEEAEKAQPTRVVIDPGLKILKEHAYFLVSNTCAKGKYRILDDGLPLIIYHSGAFSNIDEQMEKVVASRPAITLVDVTTLQSDLSIPPPLVVEDLKQRGLHHVMVEGGAATALSFLKSGLVDRAIIVRAAVEFKEPLKSGINEEILAKSGGLKKIGSSKDVSIDTEIFGGDYIDYWVKKEGDGNWPTKEIINWP